MSAKSVSQLTWRHWLEGARLRTLPAALAPVILASALAWHYSLAPSGSWFFGASWGHTGSFSLLRTVLAALVALSFQIGVNFANDYSDGVRGTDNHRGEHGAAGPLRLTASGLVSPQKVKYIAIFFLVLGCAFGLVLVALSGKWILVIAGALCVIAAWGYTGGKHPYGYIGLGEIFVFLTFGLMATTGTFYLQMGSAPLTVWIWASAIGLIACAILMVNNIRDIPTDGKSGKKTLAWRLGDRQARLVYYLMMLLPLLAVLLLPSSMPFYTHIIGLLVCAVFAQHAIGPVAQQLGGRHLIRSLKFTGIYELIFALTVSVIYVLA